MLDKRLRLSNLLRNILGSKEVYFQRPESKKMNYPAIVYELSNISSLYANDGVYLSGRTYSLTLIDKDPDSLLMGKLAAIPTCRFERHYRADNLNHWVFQLHY